MRKTPHLLLYNAHSEVLSFNAIFTMSSISNGCPESERGIKDTATLKAGNNLQGR
jgi:hypothetical protein